MVMTVKDQPHSREKRAPRYILLLRHQNMLSDKEIQTDVLKNDSGVGYFLAVMAYSQNIHENSRQLMCMEKLIFDTTTELPHPYALP